ncbi:hypothetical protein QYE76_010253 [Lolium multiflorum]|uniref:DUF4218 domain-containing protein n=1 Tax=Lolium multiflorum TaxID=4521 RepID=A0AAD8X1Y6_LOLMU|nr:hypothetical protein QYE76_010253 [Lolium multiflorum]
MWKKKSIFWELPYWKFLEVHSAIDVMHVTKNLCVNLLNFLGVYGKTKDTPDARQDQQSIHEGNNLNPEKYQGPASYALTKEEKEIFFEVLSSIKVPSGFSSNIKGIINMSEKKFQNLKSHDCHVIMTQLLPVALRGLLPKNVRVPIVKLCAFLNAISQKVINPLTLQNLQKDVVQCLVSFELVFPPSFFNIMTHLLVHLVEEIGVLGPVFLHNMFPFERFMGVLKKYVHNRARPEGSISKGYGTEEVIEFCVDFIPDLKPIGVPESRYEGRLRGKGTLGKKATTYDNGKKVTYYGYIEEIWELDYGPNFKVPLFRCKWFNLKDGVQVDPQYGMTTVDLKNLGSKMLECKRDEITDIGFIDPDTMHVKTIEEPLYNRDTPETLLRVMSWQSRTVAEFFIMITCLLNFSARFDSFGTTSSETAVALNFYHALFYLTAPNSSPLHLLRISTQKPSCATMSSSSSASSDLSTQSSSSREPTPEHNPAEVHAANSRRAIAAGEESDHDFSIWSEDDKSLTDGESDLRFLADKEAVEESEDDRFPWDGATSEEVKEDEEEDDDDDSPTSRRPSAIAPGRGI